VRPDPLENENERHFFSLAKMVFKNAFPSPYPREWTNVKPVFNSDLDGLPTNMIKLTVKTIMINNNFYIKIFLLDHKYFSVFLSWLETVGNIVAVVSNLCRSSSKLCT